MVTTPKFDENLIRQLAHKFWEEEGRPEGRADAHWLRAIESFDIPSVTPASAAAPAPVKKKAKGKR